MIKIQEKFKIVYNYSVYFIENLFDRGQNYFSYILDECGIQHNSKFLFFIDSNVAVLHPDLIKDIKFFFNSGNYKLADTPLIISGGEVVKNDFANVHSILEAIDKYGIDRHSYIVAIGGGAVLDAVGFAAAIGHRGIRHIRIPSTVLSQNDSGVGVKNGINYFGKKNFIGTFAPPFIVINDFNLLHTLSARDFRSGFAEAIKIGLIKDDSFFDFIEEHASELIDRDSEIIKQLIRRCAEIHLQHIAGGDPFEQGNSRPLDYGHWSAHKLEQLSNYRILHGEAVIMGMCLDAVYANLKGLLHEKEMMRLIHLSKKLEFKVYAPEMEVNNNKVKSGLLEGLQEFREHLGGQLTIMLLEKIGKGIEVHEMDEEFIMKAVSILKEND